VFLFIGADPNARWLAARVGEGAAVVAQIHEALAAQVS
jgi:hypothetical protein